MTDNDRTAIFVSPQGGSDADGSSQRPFGTVQAALQSAAGRAADGKLIDIDFLCVDKPGATPTPSHVRHEFFVDRFGTSADPNGREGSPWTSMEQAIAALGDLNSAGSVSLQPGDVLRLKRHKVFTASLLDRRKARTELIAKYIFLAMSLLLVAPVIAVLTYLVVEAWPALSLGFLLENPIDMGRSGGIWAPLVGTFMLVLVSLLFAAPVGVLAGVYLNEYAPNNWLTRIVNLGVVNLAGVPSIVHGLFGFGAFVLAAGMGKSVLAASCTLAVMTMPVVITSTREALAAVPMPFREACWNMGATRWQTIRTVVLPNSLRGILTGIILEISRAAGETAPILFTGAAIYLKVADKGWEALMPFGVNDQFMALSMHLFTVRTQIAGVEESMQFATAVVLIGLVLAVNSFAIALRVYLRTRKKW